MQLLRALFLLALFIGLNGVAQAQTQDQPRPQSNPKDSVSAEKGADRSESRISIGSPEQEMLARQDIKNAEKDHQENLERAREAAQLSAEIRDAYLQNRVLGRVEHKKIERLEKITRKIRSEAGGSDGEVTVENLPVQIEPALARIAELSEKVRKVVEKTPRQVVSASVIERANELLEIIRYLRAASR
jgi:DNA anti-recombination protein RmuC